MNLWILLVLIEITPILLWIAGAICEENAIKYPDVKIGYRNKLSVGNKLVWEYSNKLLSRIAGSIGTFLFVINAIVLFSIGPESIKLLVFLNVILVIFMIFIIEKSIKKKFNENGEIKKN